VSDLPSVALAREAAAPFAAVDSVGRRYTLRPMTVLDRLRLFKAVGAELAGNDAYLGLAYYACAVSAIDDVPVPLPVNEAQVEALVGRIGDAGMEAIAHAFTARDAARAETHAGN
jgi:hypothetical protein